jgi:hypothetical protein
MVFRFIWAFALGALAFSAPSAAQDASAGDRKAYEYALRCFVVDGTYGDQAGARTAFDAAMTLGRKQNLTNRQLNADLDHWTATEQVMTIQHPDYKSQIIATCRKLGLASSG